MESTEAPASLTFKLLYKGVEVLVTNRDVKTEMGPFLEKAKIIIDGAFSKGYEAPPARSFGGGTRPPVAKEYVEGKSCPTCGGKLEKKINTKTGKEYHRCENGKFNFQTKQNEGCPYVNWDPLPFA